jgi:hypothetical protein
MKLRIFGLAALLVSFLAVTASAQFKDADPEGVKMGKDKVQKWKCGVTIKAAGSVCKNVHGYAPIPIDWPEQQVSIVNEEFPASAKVEYEMREGTAKVMTIKIPRLEANQELKIIATVEIRRNAILPPEDTDLYVLPNAKKLPPDMRRYLMPSPLIESTDPKIKSLAKEIFEKLKTDKEAANEEVKAWDKVEAYYDWVREHVKYQPGDIKGALAALKDETGDCEELASLFIALCRAGEIPARTVWIPGHCYAEFYLEDKDGKGHWFPCQSAGPKEFGGINETRPILQKGDNFKPHPGQKKHQRYLAEFLTGVPENNGQKPLIRSVRELVP